MVHEVGYLVACICTQEVPLPAHSARDHQCFFSFSTLLCSLTNKLGEMLHAGCSAAPLTVAEFEAALTACTGSLVGHAVLVTSSLTPLTHQLSLLADSVPVRQGAFQLASVVAVVSSDTLWADVGRGVLLPGLQQQVWLRPMLHD
jgi:hypothetical protein